MNFLAFKSRDIRLVFLVMICIINLWSKMIYCVIKNVISSRQMSLIVYRCMLLRLFFFSFGGYIAVLFSETDRQNNNKI